MTNIFLELEDLTSWSIYNSLGPFLFNDLIGRRNRCFKCTMADWFDFRLTPGGSSRTSKISSSTSSVLWNFVYVYTLCMRVKICVENKELSVRY